MDRYRGRRISDCQFAAVLLLFLVNCISMANAWPSDAGYSKVAVHTALSKNVQLLPDPSRIHQSRKLSDALPVLFPKTFNMTTTEVKASDRSDTSRSFSSEASQPRIVYAASNRFGQEGEPYVAPPGLNSFPPNSQVDYGNPPIDEKPDPHSSYLPPASGPVEPTTHGEKHGPNSSYLPVASGPVEPEIRDEMHDPNSSYLPPASGPVEPTPRPHTVFPQTNYGPPPIVSNMLPFKALMTPPPPRQMMKTIFPTFPPLPKKHMDHPPSGPAHDYPMDYSHEHDEHHYPGHPDSSAEYLDHPPTGYHPDPPPQGKHQDHSFEHPSEASFHHGSSHEETGDHGVDVYPEVIIDHYPDHEHDDYEAFHHDHPHHPYPPPPPPPPPPPQADVIVPETPRVKKYSYFYLGRHLWYVPLYFTVWFTFYVTYLIIQSIGRHKAELPNHTRTRRSARDLSHKATVEKVNGLTQFVMEQIAGFKEKQQRI